MQDAKIVRNVLAESFYHYSCFYIDFLVVKDEVKVFRGGDAQEVNFEEDAQQ